MGKREKEGVERPGDRETIENKNEKSETLKKNRKIY